MGRGAAAPRDGGERGPQRASRDERRWVRLFGAGRWHAPAFVFGVSAKEASGHTDMGRRGRRVHQSRGGGDRLIVQYFNRTE